MKALQLRHAGFPDEPPPAVSFVVARPGKRNLVSLTPLIDVVFILLVFFMLASNFFEWRELKLSTTVAEHAGYSTGEGMHVELGRDGELKLDGKPMPMRRLCRILSERLYDHPDLAVVLQPVAGVAVQEMIAVLDQLVAAGATQLSLVATPVVGDGIAGRGESRDDKHFPVERAAGLLHRHREEGRLRQ